MSKDAIAKLIIYALLVSAVVILRKSQSVEPVGCRHNCPTEFAANRR